jgi:hypothetical protein
VRGTDGRLARTEVDGRGAGADPQGDVLDGCAEDGLGRAKLRSTGRRRPAAGSDEVPRAQGRALGVLPVEVRDDAGSVAADRGENPSYYNRQCGLAPDAAAPGGAGVWPTWFELAASVGLSLPSEAQWECGARAGTTWPRWVGATKEALLMGGQVNISGPVVRRGRGVGRQYGSRAARVGRRLGRALGGGTQARERLRAARGAWERVGVVPGRLWGLPEYAPAGIIP